jgi:beta-glucosidase
MTPASALRGLFLAFAWLVATSCSPTGNSGDAGAADAAMDKRAREILAGMSLDRKIAQLVMPDISTITPEDVERYRFGVILNGGNSGPGGNDLASAEEWLKLADAFWDASSAPMSDGQIVIPALWATDALHGHNNVPGATVFPHNIGLGATRDPDLLKRIGEATAAEVAVTGIDWTFAPTLAVTTDIRWGRTYESFSSDPELVSELGGAVIEGLQGAPGSPDFLDQSRIIATAKHFFADGGTRGKDRGDAVGDMEELKRVHVSPYRQAFAAGVGSVMASFSSVNGQKMHASEEHLTGLLRGELGFKGPVVGDWNGHGELEGCTNADCPASLMAGLDVYMVPEDWKGLYETLLAQAKDGRIPLTRIDEAVLRVLRLKLAYGLFDKPRPSERQLAGDWLVRRSANRLCSSRIMACCRYRPQRRSWWPVRRRMTCPGRPEAGPLRGRGAGPSPMRISAGRPQSFRVFPGFCPRAAERLACLWMGAIRNVPILRSSCSEKKPMPSSSAIVTTTS